MNEIETKAQFVEFFRNHKVSSPHDFPINATDGITTCSCGARWRTFYSRYGLEWKPLNEQATAHDEAQATLPDGYGLDMEGNLFFEPAPR